MNLRSIFGLIIVIYLILGICGDGYAQNSPADSAETILTRIDRLMTSPPTNDPKQALFNLNLVTAYYSWAMSFKVGWGTPLEDLVTIYQNRGRAYCLMASHKTLAIMQYARQESGVLPLLDVSIANFDTAAYYFQKVEPYVLQGTQAMTKTDKWYSKSMSDSLKIMRSEIKQSLSFMPAIEFNYWRTLKNMDKVRADTNTVFPQKSVYMWFLETAKTDSTKIKRPELLKF